MDSYLLSEKDLDLAALRQAVLSKDGGSFPAMSYTDIVLKPAYDEAKANLLPYMLTVHRAHLVMLYETKIISGSDASAIKNALERIPAERFASGQYTGKYEDLFFEVEDWLIQAAGDVAGNLHIARSRNDMGVALYRLALRDRLRELTGTAVSLQLSLAAFANAHKETLMIAHTHTQQAQPTTLGHYILGMFFVLDRDIRRLRSAFACVNRSPMGAAAITTSGFIVDRQRVSGLLGFDETIENSYDCIGGGDYLGESAAAIHLACVNLSRFVNDLLLWSTQEFGYLKVAPAYIQISSIMPQKRNPVSIEHMRSLLSSVSGDCMSITMMLHNTPYGDIVDTEDDAQPCLWRAITKLDGIYRLLYNVLATMRVDKELMRKRAYESFAVVTELADTLVREEGIPFRQAHKVAHTLVDGCLLENIPIAGVKIDRISAAFQSVVGREMGAGPSRIMDALDPQHFIDVRKVPGGPEKGVFEQMLDSAVEKMNANLGWVLEKKQMLAQSEDDLRHSFSSIPG